MFTRRNFLLTTAIASLFANKVVAKNVLPVASIEGELSWSEFYKRMIVLANGNFNEQAITEYGMQYLTQLDISSDEFKSAVNKSYESGNHYWLWQRMIKLRNVNGGILNIGNDQLVQLHDHPGVIGLLRIISGETEVWQFDQVKEKNTSSGKNIVHLVRKSYGVLRAGDTAVLTPSQGNIHALKAVSKECRMLDFFIPPYERNQRSWYEPVTEKWFDKKQITCRKISQNDFTMT